LAALVGCSALTLRAARAEDAWVRKAEVVVRDGKSGVYRPMATYRRGDWLRVVARERRWLKVDLGGGRAGWVYEDALNARPIDPDTGQEVEPASGMRYSAGDGPPSPLSESSIKVCRFGGDLREASPARRGGWAAAIYQGARRLDAAGLNSVLGVRKSLTPEQVDAFMAAGRIGPPKGGWEKPAPRPPAAAEPATRPAPAPPRRGEPALQSAEN
jgi:hypothetical protein